MRSRNITRFLAILFVLLVIGAAAYLYITSRPTDTQLKASGTVEVVRVVISPETAGKVREVRAGDGDTVQAGQLLFTLDDELLKATRHQAEAALESARAASKTATTGVETARSARDIQQANVNAAQVKADSELAAARKEEIAARQSSWSASQPDAFDQPAWYYQKSEELAAAEADLAIAETALADAEAKLKDALDTNGGEELQRLEAGLAEARSAFRNADQVRERARSQGDQDLIDEAETHYDDALAKLNDLQGQYDDLLSRDAAREVLQARAGLAVARETWEAAADQLASLQTGANSYRVKIARAAVDQANAGLAQAEQNILQAQAGADQAAKALAQGEAQLALVDIQISKLTVLAPVDGLVLTRSIEPGEVVQPGAAAFTIGITQEPTITVYVNEERYGEIMLGEHAKVSINSFPGEDFDAVVTEIAGQAEFTPRNVQTEEGRRSTVFAVKLALANTSGRLKAGMPATVLFGD